MSHLLNIFFSFFYWNLAKFNPQKIEKLFECTLVFIKKSKKLSISLSKNGENSPRKKKKTWILTPHPHTWLSLYIIKLITSFQWMVHSLQVSNGWCTRLWTRSHYKFPGNQGLHWWGACFIERGRKFCNSKDIEQLWGPNSAPWTDRYPHVTNTNSYIQLFIYFLIHFILFCIWNQCFVGADYEI